MYVQVVNEHEQLILCLYVNDLVITGSSPNAMQLVKRRLKSECEMTDLGALSYFLGFEIVYLENGIFMHQKKYVLEILKKFKMMGCKSLETHS